MKMANGWFESNLLDFANSKKNLLDFAGFFRRQNNFSQK